MVQRSNGRSKRSSRKKQDIEDIFDGPIKKRRYGLRIDDDLDITIIAGNTLMNVEGRLLSDNDDLEIVDTEGYYHRVIMDWVVDIKVIRHNRPPQSMDPEMAKRPVKQKPKKLPPDQAYN